MHEKSPVMRGGVFHAGSIHVIVFMFSKCKPMSQISIKCYML
jgi:hypothetical protein